MLKSLNKNPQQQESMDKNEFIRLLSSIKKVQSKTGKTYRILHVNNIRVEFLRQGKSTSEYISVDELINLYNNAPYINTSIAKEYISGRVQSPAVAILNTFDEQLEIHPQIVPLKRHSEGTSTSLPNSTKTKDENMFFAIFSEIVGEEYIYSKSIGAPIHSSMIFLSSNYLDYGFDGALNNMYHKILTALRSSGGFASQSLSHHIDGLVCAHPRLGNRIVEFDEEQHFTPARTETLIQLSKMLSNEYFSEYLDICMTLDYLQNDVLKKHRIKNRLIELPKTFGDFLSWLEEVKENSSGYIEQKNGFDFLGGRIAQRAYYDTLRDTAHLSPKNKLNSPLRFSKKSFEDKCGRKFSQISSDELKIKIVQELRDKYGLQI